MPPLSESKGQTISSSQRIPLDTLDQTLMLHHKEEDIFQWASVLMRAHSLKYKLCVLIGCPCSYFNENQYPDEAKREEIANACNAVIQKPGKVAGCHFPPWRSSPLQSVICNGKSFTHPSWVPLALSSLPSCPVTAMSCSSSTS